MYARNNTTNAKKQVVERKPCCKVCQDAGKSEKEYTSHYVRSLPDRNGKTIVTCPTLLAIECKYCFEQGHTTKFCPVIAANTKAVNKKKWQEAKQEEEKKKTETAKKPTQKKNASKFSILDIGSSSETEEEESNPTLQSKTVTISKAVTFKEEFPSLSSTSTTKAAMPAMPAMSGWASIAAKTQDQYETEKYEEELIANSIKRQTQSKFQQPPKPQEVKKSWADYSDDEEDDLAYEQAYQQVISEKAKSQWNYEKPWEEDW